MRKGHGSTKVPGVKLRPAPKATGQRHTLDVLDDADASETTQSGSVSQLSAHGPLAGVVLCATGISNKTQLFSQAKQLGAASSTHFTNLTTHLIAEGPGSAKYLCALERGVPIVSPDWIRDAHTTWREGGEVDVDESVKHYRLPIFSGVKLCLTGFDDVQERLRIHQLVAKDDGVYSKGFEPSVTHLVCQVDQSDKIAAARKLNKSRSLDSQIHIIWEEWFWDCLEYGGMWTCDGYSIDKPRPQRKPPMITAVPEPPKAFQEPLPPSIKNDLLIQPDDPSETGHVKHVPGVSSQIWQNIVKKRATVVGGQLRIGSSDALSPIEQISGRGAVISRVSSAKAAALHSESKPATMGRQPFSRVASMAAVAGPSRLPLQATSSLASIPSTSSHTVFTGRKFYALGDARCDALESAINDNGGRWLSQTTDIRQADFVLVRLCESARFWQDSAEVDEQRERMRTECWVEKCLYEERVCAVDEHFTFAPLQALGPLPDAEKHNICFSGVDAAEACWLKRLIRALGATYSASFTRKCTHLICDSGEGAKYERAREWDIPVVQRSWLFDLAEELNQTRRETTAKAETAGETMADITNASDSRSGSAAFASLGFDSMSTSGGAGSMSFGVPSLLVERPGKGAVPPPPKSSPFEQSSCTPSPMRFPSPRPGIHTSESAPATLGSAKGSKRTRSDDSSTKSVKRARPAGRTKVGIDRASSVVSVRSVSTPVPQAGTQDKPDQEEESMLVTYQDEAGEKERQRLLRMFSAPAAAAMPEDLDAGENDATPVPPKKAAKPKTKPAGRRRVGGF